MVAGQKGGGRRGEGEERGGEQEENKRTLLCRGRLKGVAVGGAGEEGGEM